MPAPIETQAATLERFINAWKNWDAQEWLSTFADDFKQVTFPLRMAVPSRTKVEAAHILPALVATVKNYQLIVHHVVHDAQNNKAAVYASSTGDLPWGSWDMEYAAFVTFSEDGSKIAAVEEMMDSVQLNDFAPKFQQYMQYHGGPAAVAAMA